MTIICFVCIFVEDPTVAGHRGLIGCSCGPRRVYGERCRIQFVRVSSCESEAERMRLWFTHAEGTTSVTQKGAGCEVAGDDHHFVAATARSRKAALSAVCQVSVVANGVKCRQRYYTGSTVCCV